MRRIVASVMLVFTSMLGAEEISTNGTGGGAWSDPATWRGGKVPTAGDDAVIRKFDVVTVAGERAVCRKLQVDPKGVLQLKTGVGKVMFAAADVVECHGAIKLDGTKNASDHLAFHLVGTAKEHRSFTLGRGGALLLYGKAGATQPNVEFGAAFPDKATDHHPVTMTAEGGGAIDWQHARVSHVRLQAKKIDNTGARPGERLQIKNMRFVGKSSVQLTEVDTPIIAGNTFDLGSEVPLDQAAIGTSQCPLAEIKGNRIAGKYEAGIMFASQPDTSIVDNHIERAANAIQSAGTSHDLMIKGNRIASAKTAITLVNATGVVEDTEISEVTTAFHLTDSTVQIHRTRIDKLAAKGQAIAQRGGTVSIHGCNIAPDDVAVSLSPSKTGKLICHAPVIVKVPGAPAGSLVEIRTDDKAIPLDSADPNVRNSPAPLNDGTTPSARSLTPLVVQRWVKDGKAKALLPAPKYVVKVLGPAKADEDRPVLKTESWTPPAESVEAELMLEVKLK